jgi:hypothetical protein
VVREVSGTRYILVEPDLGEAPKCPGRGHGAVMNGGGIAVERRRNVSDVEALCFRARGELLSDVIEGAIGEVYVGEAGTDWLVDVQHVDLVVERELVESGRVGGNGAGEEGRVFKGCCAGAAADEDGRGGGGCILSGL